MKKLLLLFTLLSLVGKSQQSTFSKLLVDSLYTGVEVRSVTAAPDNSYLLAGLHYSGCGLVLKVDSSGSVIWHRKIEAGTNSGAFSTVSSTNDSCSILGGSYYNPLTFKQEGFYTKINFNGDTLWSKSIFFSGYNKISIVSIQQAADSGYIITGVADSTSPPYGRFFILKLDAAGQKQWSSIITGGGTSSNEVYSVKQTPDGGYIIAGTCNNISPGSTSPFLLKLSANGSIAWSKKYQPQSGNYSFASDVLVVGNGFLLFEYAGNPTLVKTDSLGNVLWSAVVPGSNFSGTIRPKVHKTSDNGFVVTGNDCGISTMTKCDSAGNIAWIKNIVLITVDALESPDKGFFIVGNGPLCGVKMMQPMAAQIGIIKTDSLGDEQNCVYNTVVPTASVTITSASLTFNQYTAGTVTSIHPLTGPVPMLELQGCVDQGGGIHEQNANADVTVWPNPSNGIFTLKINSATHAKLLIYNCIGQIIQQSEIFNPGTEINLHENAKGIYFYKVIFSDNKFANGKLVIAQ